MTEVEKQTKALAAGIRKSSEHEAYRRTYTKLCMQPELLKQVNRFRRYYFLLLNQPEGEDKTNQIIQLEEKFSAVLKNGAVREFLAAQQRLCTMMQEIYRALDDAADLELGFMFEPEEEQ